MSARFTGGDQIKANARKAMTQGRAGTVTGIRRAMQQVLDVSNSQVPHEEGDLERDGAASVDEATLRGAVSYGRNAETAKYAVPQHERLDYRHDPGRNAKYLENAFNSEAATALRIVQEQTRRGMGT